MQTNRTHIVLGRRLAASALIASLTFGTVPTAAFAATSSDLQTQLEQAQAESATYEQQTAEAFQELEDFQGQLEDTKAAIASTRDEIAQKQDELEQAQSTLANRVSADYKSGGVSLVSLVMGSSSAEDLVSRITYANKAAQSDAEAISQVQSIQKDLDQKQADLEAQQSQQETLVADAQSKADEVQQKQSDHEAYVNSLSADVQQALAEEEAARKAEEERKAAEAAAAAAAQTQQDANTGDAANTGNGGTTDNGASEEQGTPSNNNQTTPSSPATPNKPSKNNNTSSNTSTNYGSGVSAAIAAAKSQLGVSYSWGGNAIANQEFDCSGLVWWAYRQAGISIPRGQRMSNGRGNSMIGWVLDGGGWVTDQSQLQPGDLMFWGSSVNSTTHVGMYIGGGKMIHSNYNGVEIASAYYSAGSFVGGGPIA